MRCPECGATGYSRKTKTPEWRCSKCGHEWDAINGEGATHPSATSTGDKPRYPTIEEFLSSYDKADVEAARGQHTNPPEPQLDRAEVGEYQPPRRSLGKRLGDVAWTIYGPLCGFAIWGIVIAIKNQPGGDLSWLIVAPLVLLLGFFGFFIFYLD